RQGQRFDCSSAEGAGDQSQRRLSSKLCSRPLSHKSARVPPAIELLSRSEHDFLGLELGQKAGQLGPGRFSNQELTGGKLQKGGADVFSVRKKGGQRPLVPPSLEEGAGRDHPDHVALDDPPLLRPFELLTNSDLVAFLD